MLKNATREFCSNTALHGYKFLVLPKRYLFERTIWSAILIMSVITAIVISWFAWKSTQRCVVQTVTDSTHHPIWNYPFPAVTVCNFNQISKSKMSEMIRRMKRPNIPIEDLVREFRHISHLIPAGNEDMPVWNLTRLQDILDNNNISAERMLQNVAPNCAEMLQRCKWKGEETPCEVLFQQVKTYLGFCCSFNYYAIKNHLFSGALPHKTPPKPRKVSGSGYKTGLEVLVDNKPDDYFATDVASYGNRNATSGTRLGLETGFKSLKKPHKILIHHPYNFPDWSIQNLWLGMHSSMFVSVSPIITQCSEKAADLPITDRKCLFATEKNLHNFRFYTYHNCLIECRIMMLIKLCEKIDVLGSIVLNPKIGYIVNAIKFTISKKLINFLGSFSNNRICNLRDTMCLLKSKHIIMSSVPGIVSKFQSKENKLVKKLDKCACLPDCDTCDYPTECSLGKFSRKYSSNEQSFYGGMKIENQSTFMVFFNDLVGSRNTKVLCYYWHTFFALFGGLLSLFTGFSFGSAFELVYFFIIRLAVKALQRKYAKNRKPKKKKRIFNEKHVNKNLFYTNLGKGLVTSIPLKHRSNFVYFDSNINDTKKNVRNNPLSFVN